MTAEVKQGLETIKKTNSMKESEQHLEEEPRYQHDCAKCTFLGWYGDFDLYFCTQSGLLPTVVSRHGEGSRYSSGLQFAKKPGSASLFEAKQRAIKLGLLKEDQA